MDHTPKNILIRGVKKNKGRNTGASMKYKQISVGNQAILSYEELLQTFGIQPTLDRLLREYIKELEERV